MLSEIRAWANPHNSRDSFSTVLFSKQIGRASNRSDPDQKLSKLASEPVSQCFPYMIRLAKSRIRVNMNNYASICASISTLVLFMPINKMVSQRFTIKVLFPNCACGFMEKWGQHSLGKTQMIPGPMCVFNILKSLFLRRTLSSDHSSE